VIRHARLRARPGDLQGKPEADNFNDPWLSRARYIAATRHQESFLNAYNADPAKLPFAALPVPLRMGAGTPDWRMPKAAEIAADWKEMRLPGNWESNGLPDFDGIVWFTKDVNVTGDPPETLALGPIRNTARVWVNGALLTPAGGGRGGGGGGPAAAAPPAAAHRSGAGGARPRAGAAAAVAEEVVGARSGGRPVPRRRWHRRSTAGGGDRRAPLAGNVTAPARAADVTHSVPAGAFHTARTRSRK
jgi:hypothetical protein